MRDWIKRYRGERDRLPKTSDGPLGYEKDHATNKPETTNIRAIQPPKTAASSDLSIRLSNSEKAVV
jgi:hypothetical protein